MPKRSGAATAVLLAFALAPFALAREARAQAPTPDPAPPAPVEAPRPLVAKVEHFFASAPDADRLFLFFRDTLQLPQVWGYQSWGDFASGGVSLGNVVFELVSWKVPAGETLATELAGIAFEPGGPTDAAVAELARRGIAHDPPEPNLREDAGGRKVGWINTGLPDLASWNVFFCDYVPRERVAQGRASASEELDRRQGGPLGVLELGELVLGAADVETASSHWRRLLDSSAQEAGGVFTFGPGPAVRLVPAAKSGIQRMVVRVRSLERARSFLADQRLLGEVAAGAVTIAPEAIGGLAITLVEAPAAGSPAAPAPRATPSPTAVGAS